MKPLRRTAAVLLAVALSGCAREGPRELRVCADPNNLPFSNRAGEGFENKLIELVARDLGARVSYTWWAQRRGNIRETLNEGLCDVIPGVATELEMLATTRPYYRSTYAAVTRAGQRMEISSFDDPRLRELKIGVQMIGDDFSNTPPAHALARRGLVRNVRGYMVYGDYRSPAPQADIIEAVASGEIDVAFVWGPPAGFFAARQAVPLRVTPLEPQQSETQPLSFEISMGTRRRDEALRGELDAVLAARAGEIQALLRQYGVPLAG